MKLKQSRYSYTRLSNKLSTKLLISSYLLIIFTDPQIFATNYAGDFEEFGASARAIGIGGAYVAAVNDPSAIYYNPAASITITNPQFIFLHSENFENGVVKNNFLGFVLPQSKQVYGVAVMTNRVPEIKITKLPNPNLPPSDSNPPYIDKIVNAADWIVYLNYARLVHPNISLGGNLKLIYRSIGIGSCYGMGLDFGILTALNQNSKIGIKVTNVTTSPLFWSNQTREAMSPKISFGIAKSIMIKTSSLQLSSDLESSFDKFNINTNLGFEYAYKNVLAFRIGLFHFNPTFGVGISYKRFFIDYAYLTNYHTEELGGSQKFSGGIRL
ncbi:MAG: PorV/PorQ family protein [candidate division WOR-3 bacterium]